jgi:hypothetical protein
MSQTWVKRGKDAKTNHFDMDNDDKAWGLNGQNHFEWVKNGVPQELSIKPCISWQNMASSVLFSSWLGG